MAKYNTMQKEQLLCFLNDHKSEAFTVKEISDMMKKSSPHGKAPGESTLYRLIKELVAGGAVKRTVKGNSRKFVYQITDGVHCSEHLHMKCVNCGRLYHMDDEDSKALVERILKNESFEIDKSTVLSGKCEECRR